MVNTTPIREAAVLIFTCDPLNRNAGTLLRVIERLQRESGSPFISEEAARGHGLQKRLSAAIDAMKTHPWTPEESDLLGRAINAAEGHYIRDRRLQVRLTDDELQQIQALAKKSGQEVSAFVRAKLGLTDSEENHHDSD